MVKHRWCDLTCEYAEFPNVDALSGACRTLSTLFCKKHRRLVQKNSPCIDSLNTRSEEKKSPSKSS